MNQEEQDEIQEDTTSMEEKLGALNQENKVESWEIEFDVMFPAYLGYTDDVRGILENPREKIKSFIRQLLTSERERVVGILEGLLLPPPIDLHESGCIECKEALAYNQALADAKKKIMEL